MAEASLSSATLEKASTELFEDPAKTPERVLQLREAINKWTPNPDDPHEANLQFDRLDDDKFLLRFLRTKKFDIDRSCELFVNFYKYRAKYAHLLGDMTVENDTCRMLMSNGALCVLPPREGPRVVVVQVSCIDFEIVATGDMIKTMLLVFDRLLEVDESVQIHGIMALEDLSGFSLWAAMKLAGQEAARKGVVVELMQESYPARFKGINFMNQPWYFSLVFSLIRPFLKQKLKERFHMHGGDIESLHAQIPPEDLPAEYGGSLLEVQNYTADKLFSS